MGRLSVPPGLCSEVPHKPALAALAQRCAERCSRSQSLKQDILLFFFLLFKFLFIYLFIYGCVGSSFLCEGFL